MDRISKEKRSKIMAAIRSKNTKPELALRKTLWKMGLRFRVHYGKQKIDIAFPSKKVAVFIDGCFWHGCPTHSHMPKSHKEYWLPKLKKNVARDIITNEHLRNEGWKVMRFWEHELVNIEEIVNRIQATLKKV